MLLLYVLLVGVVIFISVLLRLRIKWGECYDNNNTISPSRHSPKKPPLPIVYAFGNAFDFGYSIGKQTKYAIRRRLEQENFANVLLPFVKKGLGKKLLEGFVELNRRIFPKYFLELKGIAEGSETDIDQIYVLNFRDELMHFADNTNVDGAVEKVVQNDTITRKLLSAFSSEHCTDLHLNGKKINSSSSDEDAKDVILGHNEDGKEYDIENVYLLIGEVHNSNNSVSRFTTLAFAGESFNTVGWNEHLGFTFNALEPDVVPKVGIGRNFIARALLDVKNIEEAIAIIKIGEPNQSFGHSYNIADFDTNTTYNVETAPGSVSVFNNSDSDNGFYFHANLYRRLEIAQTPSLSSEHRLKVVESQPLPKDMEDIRSLLGNTQDHELPVYRTNLPTDGGTTLYSVIFNVTKKKVFIFNTNPALTDAFIVMRMTA